MPTTTSPLMDIIAPILEVSIYAAGIWLAWLIDRIIVLAHTDHRRHGTRRRTALARAAHHVLIGGTQRLHRRWTTRRRATSGHDTDHPHPRRPAA